MAYVKTNWKDRVVERPNTYTMTDNGNGTVTLTPVPGQIIERGTPLNAENLNKIEDAIVETNTQLLLIDSKKAPLSYVDTAISQIKSATPKGVYANLNALISAKPTGDDNIYLTLADGQWNYWNGNSWVAGGLYQATELDHHSIASYKLNFNAVNGMDSFNLFNPEAVTKGYYVSASSGNLIANENNNASEYIEVNESLPYFVRVGSGDANFPMAWYDVNKTFIGGVSGVSKTKCGFLMPPNGAKYCRLSISAGEADNKMDNFLFCQSNVVEEYEPYCHKVGVNQLGIKVCELVKSKNMFDKSTVTLDKYISGSSGVLGTSTNHVASDWIKVKPSTDYTFSKSNGNFEQYAFYDKDQIFISGVTKPSSGKYTTPSNCYYVRHTVSKVQLDGFMLNEGEEMEYEEFGYFIPKEVMPTNNDFKFINIITVDKNGNGDFKSIYDAVASIKSTSPTNRYEIRIAEGEYDIISELPSEMVNNPNSFPGGRGIDIPSYVKLVGVGHRDKIIIKGELPDDATVEQVKYLSTINYGDDVALENLTITAKNMRYPIHADSGSQAHNNVYQVINCHVIHYGNQPSRWQYCSCFGSGHGKNAKVLMKDSCFETYGRDSNAWGIHNYTTATEKSNMILENCEFIAHNGGASCAFESMGSGIKDYALIKNCYIPNGVLVTENSVGVGIDIIVEGYNNSTSLTKY